MLVFRLAQLSPLSLHPNPLLLVERLFLSLSSTLSLADGVARQLSPFGLAQ